MKLNIDMLTDMKKYKNSLSALWNRVFGDSYEHINRIFEDEYKNDILCFAHIENEKAVSAFYLLRSCLRFDGNSYNGWYLYAAATLPEYRSKGLMGRLIKEAQQFCINEGYDYISLVPADEELYGYYGSFGFHEAMYCCRSIFHPSHDKNRSCSLITDREHIKIMRDAYKGNMFAYKNKACDYALSVLSAGDADFLQLTDTAYCIYDSNDCQVIEFICDEKKISQEAEFLMKAVKGDNLTVYSPYDLSKITDESFIEKFGMIYPVNKKLIREWKLTDIYMNLALN